MPDETQKERHAPHVLTTLAGVLIAFLLLAAIYVVYQAAHILFPQNVYETALPAVISDTVEADGVLLFDESYVAAPAWRRWPPSAGSWAPASRRWAWC